MDYQIALSPDLHISADEFVSAWNDSPECRDTARAELAESPPAGYPIAAGAALIFLAGVATAVATNVLSNLITKILEDRLLKKQVQPPIIQVIAIEQPDGSRLLVVQDPPA